MKSRMGERMFKKIKNIVVPSKDKAQVIIVGQRMQCRTTHKRKNC